MLNIIRTYRADKLIESQMWHEGVLVCDRMMRFVVPLETCESPWIFIYPVMEPTWMFIIRWWISSKFVSIANGSHSWLYTYVNWIRQIDEEMAKHKRYITMENGGDRMVAAWWDRMVEIWTWLCVAAWWDRMVEIWTWGSSLYSGVEGGGCSEIWCRFLGESYGKHQYAHTSEITEAQEVLTPEVGEIWCQFYLYVNHL